MGLANKRYIRERVTFGRPLFRALFLDILLKLWYNSGEDIKIKTQSVFGG